MVYTNQKRNRIDDKFKVNGKGLERLTDYKERKRKNIKGLISYIILGIIIYAFAYTCNNHQEKIRGRLNETTQYVPGTSFR